MQLSQLIKIHNIFQPNLLQKVSIDSLINQINEPPTLVIINNNEKLEIEDILDAKSYQGKL